MGTARIEVTPEALREIDDAFEYYRQRSPRAAEGFVREIERGLALIANGPKIWPLFEAGTRRYILHKFPYSIIYREISEGLRIIAVAHHKRRPRYWVGRLLRGGR